MTTSPFIFIYLAVNISNISTCLDQDCVCDPQTKTEILGMIK